MSGRTRRGSVQASSDPTALTYFEFIHGTSKKFWEIQVKGTKAISRWGRIGSDGVMQEKQFDTRDEAIDYAQQKRHEKTNEGYDLKTPSQAAKRGAGDTSRSSKRPTRKTKAAAAAPVAKRKSARRRADDGDDTPESEELDEEEDSEVTTAFKDFVFCISGTLSMKRRDFQKLLMKNGAEVAASVNNSVTHLIVENPRLNTTKTRAAHDKGVIVVDEQWVYDKISKHLLKGNVAEEHGEDEGEEEEDSTLLSGSVSQRSSGSKRDREQTPEEKEADELRSGVFFIDEDLELLPDGQMRTFLLHVGLAVTDELSEEVTHIVVADAENAPDFKIGRGRGRKKVNASIVDENWILDNVHRLLFKSSAPESQVAKSAVSSLPLSPKAKAAISSVQHSAIPPPASPQKKKQKSKAYGVAFESDGMQSLLACKEFNDQVVFDTTAAAQELDIELEAGDDFREWDFSAGYWEPAKQTKIKDKKIKSFILPYGKYCADMDEPCAWITWKQLAAQYCTRLTNLDDVPTLFDVYEAVGKFYNANLEKIEDGFFIVGFEISTDGTWLTAFEA